MRIPNCNCNTCLKPIYRRPFQLIGNQKVYCSKECFWKIRGKIEEAVCKTCGNNFIPFKRSSTFCSKSCANTNRRGKSYSKISAGNKSQVRLALLKNTFNFKCCMVLDCTYCKTYDVHRLVEGKDCGKYEIGNMFAICPNHHAEIHRKIIRLEKISDCQLKAIEI